MSPHANGAEAVPALIPQQRALNPNGWGLPTWARWTDSADRIHLLQPDGSRSLAEGAFRTQHQCGYWDGLLGTVAGGE